MNCPILTNHNTTKEGRCKRFWLCQAQGRTTDERCPARGQKK